MGGDQKWRSVSTPSSGTGHRETEGANAVAVPSLARSSLKSPLRRVAGVREGRLGKRKKRKKKDLLPCRKTMAFPLPSVRPPSSLAVKEAHGHPTPMASPAQMLLPPPFFFLFGGSPPPPPPDASRRRGVRSYCRDGSILVRACVVGGCPLVWIRLPPLKAKRRRRRRR